MHFIKLPNPWTVSSMASALSVPVHVKIRLCNPATDTPKLALRLVHAGASLIVIHARHVSANRRRAGPAQLDWVRQTIEFLQESGVDKSVRVISNGNVEKIEDCSINIAETGASGLMLGEAILANPTQRTPYFKTFLAQLEACERLEDFAALVQSPELLAAWPNPTDATK
ncbi:hypothetical protein FS837_000590 [Tulasnella sp. UAMH 9824]|nr:hypothetical protein FS837_000590 [Tulasnella sp. UAMH 9824]